MRANFLCFQEAGRKRKAVEKYKNFSVRYYALDCKVPEGAETQTISSKVIPEMRSQQIHICPHMIKEYLSWILIYTYTINT